MKVSTGHAVFVGESRIRTNKPPGSPEAIYAIYTVGKELHGDTFQLWDPAYRQAIYDQWYPRTTRQETA